MKNYHSLLRKLCRYHRGSQNP